MKLVIILALLIGALQATPQTTLQATNHIERQIYITRKDRETVKLSLVTIRIVEINKCSQVMAQVASYATARENDAEWRKRATSLADAMPTMSAANRATAQQTYDKLRSQIITNAPYAKLGEKTLFELLRNADWQPERTTQTDADGKFNIDIPSGSWKIVALASRDMLSKKEEYIWVESIPPTGRMLLNNSNLLRARGQ